MPTFERSDLTEQLVRHLRAFDKGAQVSYEDIARWVDAAIDARSAHLRSARLILERDHNQVWLCVRPGVGLYRADDAEIAARLRSWWLSGARRKLDRGGDQASTVESGRLDAAEQLRFSVDCIQRELAFQTLDRATQRRIEKVASGSSNDLPSFTAVEWAISLMPRKAQPAAS